MKAWLLVSGALFGGGLSAQAQQVALQAATATYSQDGFPVSTAIDGSLSSGINGWAIDGLGAPTAVFETAANLTLPAGQGLRFTLHQLYTQQGHTLGRFRLSVTTDDRALFADGLANGGDVTANWTVLAPTSAVSSNGATLSVLGDNSVLASGVSPPTDVYDITADTLLTNITGFRLETLQDASLPDNGPGRMTNGNFVLTEFQVFVTPVPEPTGIVFIVGAAALVYRRLRAATSPNAEPVATADAAPRAGPHC